MSVSGTAISAIIFYLAIILLIYYNRKKFDFQGKIIAMYRTKIGLKTMRRWGQKGERFVKTLARIGIYVGFTGMAFVVYMIIEGLFKLLFIPEAPPTFAPVLPGIKIPGVEIFVPFWYGIIALFLTIVVHEFSHGVVANAHKLKVKNSGFVMFGPLPGAFVEPDEKTLRKAKPKTQLAIYAAGPFSNILLTILLILLFGFLPMFVNVAGGTPSEGLQTFTKYTSIVNTYRVQQELYRPVGLTILTVEPGSAADTAGLENLTTITAINGQDIRENESSFGTELERFTNLTPGTDITFANDNNTYRVTTLPDPDNESKGLIGITFDQFLLTERDPAAIEKYGHTGITFFEMLFQQVFWLILLSSGIGLANLLPLGPVDGGRMLLVALQRWLPDKKARRIWGKVSLIVFISVIILVVVPIFKAIIT
ncbi:site-2 protease family protein [Candidatus Woesearchaeota archaeon]|nr:site-2 protease family protein [Candidatus Woesearchaeota archaeon]